MTDNPTAPATDADIAEYNRLADAATAGPWDWASHKCESIQDAGEYFARMMNYNPDNLEIHMLAHMLDGSHAPESLDDVWSFVVPCLTGNGPTARKNAWFIRAARTAVPALCARVESDAARIQALETALDGVANYLAMLIDDHREIRFARGEEEKARAALKGKE